MPTSTSSCLPIKPVNKSTSYIASLTGVRGILAFWVCIFHMSDHICSLVPEATAGYSAMRAGFVSVPAFFVLSGYVMWINYGSKMICFRWKSVVDFLIRRFRRLYPVHLFSLLATLMLFLGSKALGIEVPHELYSARDFVLNLFLIHTWVPKFQYSWNYPSWSISSEWFAYILFPLFCVTIGKIANAKFAWLACFTALITTLVLYSIKNSILFFTMIEAVAPFLVGMCGAIAINKTESFKVIPTATPDGLFALLIVLTCFLSSTTIGNVGFVLCSGLVLSLGILGEKCSFFWRNRITVFLGEISYSLYLTHFLVIKFGSKIVPSLDGTGSALGAAVVFAYFFAVLSVAYAVHRFIEKPFLIVNSHRNIAGPPKTIGHSGS